MRCYVIPAAAGFLVSATINPCVINSWPLRMSWPPSKFSNPDRALGSRPRNLKPYPAAVNLVASGLQIDPHSDAAASLRRGWRCPASHWGHAPQRRTIATNLNRMVGCTILFRQLFAVFTRKGSRSGGGGGIRALPKLLSLKGFKRASPVSRSNPGRNPRPLLPQGSQRSGSTSSISSTENQGGTELALAKDPSV